MHGCEYKKGFCATQTGKYLKWDKNRDLELEYIKVGKFNATKVGNHILIPLLAMTFKKSTNNDTWVDRNFKLEGRKLETNSRDNSKVATSDSDQASEKVKALREELQSKFAYLIDLIQSPMAKTQYLCDVFNALYQNERVLAAIDATLYIRGKLNDSALFAMHAGEFIVVYPCYEISNVTFTKEEGKCHNGIPIKYKLPGKSERKGYLNPVYNNVMPRGIEIDCHTKGNTYSYVNGELNSHSPHGRDAERINMSSVFSLQHIPIAGIPLPEDYLNTDWVYNVSDLAHPDMGDKVLDALEKEIEQLNEHKSKFEGDATVKSTSKWWNILGIFETNIFGGIHAIIMWAERFCVIYIMWIVVIKGKLWHCRARVRENAAANVPV
jgi:hypothetical protein